MGRATSYAERRFDFPEIAPNNDVTVLTPRFGSDFDFHSRNTIESQLILKGMVWSPSHGDTAFTVPLFEDFMRRIMPGDDWRTEAFRAGARSCPP